MKKLIAILAFFILSLTFTETNAQAAWELGVRFYERPIHYARRSFAEGKKIGWRDGLAALWCIFRYSLFS